MAIVRANGLDGQAAAKAKALARAGASEWEVIAFLRTAFEVGAEDAIQLLLPQTRLLQLQLIALGRSFNGMWQGFLVTAHDAIDGSRDHHDYAAFERDHCQERVLQAKLLRSVFRTKTRGQFALCRDQFKRYGEDCVGGSLSGAHRIRHVMGLLECSPSVLQSTGTWDLLHSSVTQSMSCPSLAVSFAVGLHRTSKNV